MQIQSSYSITYLMRQETNHPFRLCTVFCPGTVELISLGDGKPALAVCTSWGDHTESSWGLWSQFLLLLPFALLTHCWVTFHWSLGTIFSFLKGYKWYVYHHSSLLTTLQKFTFPTTSLPSISPPQKSCCIKLSFKYVFNTNNKYYI